ncbi:MULTISPECIES: GlmU family protein [Croceibacter]|uniref:GlmU family protein n=2 Tax=Flavobacteriaceae TaxID=49546 RepID=UPI000C48A6E6|nr:GlmU family protein [Croceibacter sp.]MBG25793.1 glucose-1-phosphate thymidylyltransferase [Croceibacter sp.]|tara:strand:+ start:3487 stop:4659 length:1173 start_codon:yes stop_codon:yes gene_type:complete
MNYILFDGAHRDSLLPFTYTRPVAEIRIGILTIREKWEQYLGITTTTVTEDYLSKKWPMVEMEHNIMISASYLPNPNLVEQIKNLKVGQALVHETEIVAFYTLEDEEKDLEDYQTIEIDSAPITVKHTWDIFSKNGDAIKEDYNLITEDRSSQPLSSSVFAVNPNNIFIEEGAKVFNVSLNAENGPIYIGKDAEVMEGSIIRGPFALCEHASTKLGTKIYGPTTVGPQSKVGGEVNNSVIFGYSNKGHDGFLGNSVLGEWCNIGADSNNSNLKNNYAEVRLWSYETEGFAKTGLQFCGLMMGDHSKCGINTMFNTGTVVGVSSNIFGAGFPRNFVPSFSWGGSAGTQTYLTKKAFEVAEIVMKRREIEFSDDDKAILEHVFEETAKFRRS